MGAALAGNTIGMRRNAFAHPMPRTTIPVVMGSKSFGLFGFNACLVICDGPEHLLSAQFTDQQQRQAQHEAEQKARMHPAQQDVIPQISEVRHAAFLDCEIAHRRR